MPRSHCGSWAQPLRSSPLDGFGRHEPATAMAAGRPVAVELRRNRKKRPVERVLPVLYAAIPLLVISFFGQQQTDGQINDATAQSSAQLRTLNDIQKYFNTHAMMYNRKLQLAYATEASATDSESSQRSDVDNAISKYHPIAAMVEGTAPEIDEYTKNKVLTDHWETLTEELLQKEAPYAWGQNSPTDAAELEAEWICKQLKGYPPIHGIKIGRASCRERV